MNSKETVVLRFVKFNASVKICNLFFLELLSDSATSPSCLSQKENISIPCRAPQQSAPKVYEVGWRRQVSVVGERAMERAGEAL
jgi:hypothetical protein